MSAGGVCPAHAGRYLNKEINQNSQKFDFHDGRRGHALLGFAPVLVNPGFRPTDWAVCRWIASDHASAKSLFCEVSKPDCLPAG